MIYTEPLCALENVQKSYGGTRVLGPVTMSVSPGELVALRGPNGAGKSTLMELMAGVTRPDAGVCTRSARALEATGYVPQELSLYEGLSALDNLKFWGLALGLPPKAFKARSRWLLERLGLSDRGRSPVSALSGGMKRRLHLASALMLTPALLLLDEPTVGADAESCEVILDLLAHLKSLGTGVVLISHREEDLERADRVVTLEGGRITGGAPV